MKLQYYVAILVILDRNQWLQAQSDQVTKTDKFTENDTSVKKDSVTHISTVRKTDSFTICSSYVGLILSDLCDKKINIVKRDTLIASTLLKKITPKDLQEHMNKQRLMSTERWRRVRRQIATECCVQPCTIANLILYCSDTAKLVIENPDIFD